MNKDDLDFQAVDARVHALTRIDRPITTQAHICTDRGAFTSTLQHRRSQAHDSLFSRILAGSLQSFRGISAGSTIELAHLNAAL